MMVLGAYVGKAGLDWLGPLESIIVANSWTEILDKLNADGKSRRVAVIPDATIQYFPDL